MIFPGTTPDIDASADGFFSMKNENSLPWSLQVAPNADVNGGPTFQIMVSNKSAAEADMVPYSTASYTSNSVAITTAMVSDGILPFAWIGIKYLAGGATTGRVAFYFNQNAIKTVLY